jgi:TrmH family RNA methyltransferase
MLSHNQIKQINSLKIKKFRLLTSTFIIEGEKGINELLESSISPVKIYALSEWAIKNKTLLKEKNIEVQEITETELKKISDLTTPNQVLAIANIPQAGNIPILNDSLVLALDGIRDPGNMGTMIRTADWFGIRSIVCSLDCVDIYNPKVIQSTMGSYSRVEVFYTDLPDYFSKLPKNTPIFGALLTGPDITVKTFSQTGIILIGSESHGISQSLLPFVNEPLHIPRFSSPKTGNQAESLNASIANGIICYEICKQLFK